AGVRSDARSIILDIVGHVAQAADCPNEINWPAAEIGILGVQPGYGRGIVASHKSIKAAKQPNQILPKFERLFASLESVAPRSQARSCGRRDADNGAKLLVRQHPAGGDARSSFREHSALIR